MASIEQLSALDRLRRLGRMSWVQAVLDAGAWLPGLTFALVVRFNFHVDEVDWFGFLAFLLLAAIAQVTVGLTFGLYLRRLWFGSFEEVAVLARATAVMTGVLFIADIAISNPHMVPLSVVLGGALGALAIMLGVRYAWRATIERWLRRSLESASRTIVFGAGDGGVSVISSMLHEPQSPYLPVALIDDDPSKSNLKIKGIPVLGTREQLADVATAVNAATLLIAAPSLAPEVVLEVSEDAVSCGLDVRTLPPVSSLFGTVGLADIHPIESPAAFGPISFATPDVTEGDVNAVVTVLRSGWLTTGHVSAALEADLAKYLDIPYVVAVASCTAALEIAFAALGLPPGSRVGVPTWTFVSTALAPHRFGCVPVLLDVEPDTLNLSAESLSVALQEGLDAVVPVHFAGTPVDAAIHELCRDAGVPVIEDAAHALGAQDDRGRVSGRGSYAACFSFYATKNLTSGEGGALATEDPQLAEFARSFRIHGMTQDAIMRYRPGSTGGYDIVAPGIKANMPDVLAALARSQLRRYEDMQSRRRQIVQRYERSLAHVPELRVVPSRRPAGSADHLLVVALPDGVDRSLLVKSLSSKGIGTSVHFQPLHHFRNLRPHVQVVPTGTPVADRMASRVLSLPLHAGLRDDQVDLVCAAVIDGLNDQQ